MSNQEYKSSKNAAQYYNAMAKILLYSEIVVSTSQENLSRSLYFIMEDLIIMLLYKLIILN